jgi:hypothetical protein
MEGFKVGDYHCFDIDNMYSYELTRQTPLALSSPSKSYHEQQTFRQFVIIVVKEEGEDNYDTRVFLALDIQSLVSTRKYVAVWYQLSRMNRISFRNSLAFRIRPRFPE